MASILNSSTGECLQLLSMYVVDEDDLLAFWPKVPNLLKQPNLEAISLSWLTCEWVNKKGHWKTYSAKDSLPQEWSNILLSIEHSDVKFVSKPQILKLLSKK